jgi:hypothetical protein
MLEGFYAMEKQNLYNIATIGMILHFGFIFIPIVSCFWIPFVGVWLQWIASILGVWMSYELSKKLKFYLSRRSYIVFSALLINFIVLIGAICQQKNLVNQFNNCNHTIYLGEDDLHPDEMNRTRTSHNINTDNDIKMCFVNVLGGSYSPSFVINGIIVPLLSFVQMILYCLRCNDLRKKALSNPDIKLNVFP